MSFKPRVSIIIPAYNAANYLSEAIESALSQTYDNIEIIVVNDGSNDDGATRKIAQKYGNKILYFEKENGGVSSALNLGISMSKGDYISWLSHDDVYVETKVENQVALLEEIGSKEAIVMCSTQQINSVSKKIGTPTKTQLPLRKLIDWKQALMYVINHSCNGCALLIPKSSFEYCGNFDEGLRYSQDFLMWVKFFMSGYSLIYHDDVEVYSRVHSQQVSVVKKELFNHDSTIIANMLIPKLAKLSCKDYMFLYAYAKTNAIHLNRDAVDKCIKGGRKSGIISIPQYLKLKFLCVYGAIRPYIRKIYYLIIKRVKNI